MVTADVSVRIAWPADSAGIAQVQVRSWRERYGALPAADGVPVTDDQIAEAWRATLSRPPEARHRALVALAHDTVVGFGLTVPCVDPDGDPGVDGEMAEFTIDPLRRNEGHGSRLLQACADTLAADRFTRAVCWVDSTDDASRAFLTGAGWAADGASRELAGPGGDDDRHGREASGHERTPPARTVRQVRLHTSLQQ